MLPGVPVEMIGRPRWVRHKDKRPLTASGLPASSTDSSTWGSLRAVLASDVGDGVGFVLGGGIGCLDLDHCLTPSGLTSFARRVLEALPSTYVEVSPSGTGLHVFGWVPERLGRRRPGVEVYSRARYMTVTGVPFEGSPAVLGDLDEVALALTTA